MRAYGRRAWAVILSAVAAARRSGPLPRVALAAVVALSLLTTFTTDPRTSEPVAPAAAPGDTSPTDADAETMVPSVEVPPATEFDGAATSEFGRGTDELPDIPDVGDERELSPFERSPVGGLEDDEVAPADLIVRADEGQVDPDDLAEPLTGAQHAAVAAGLTASIPGTADEDGAEDRKVSILGIDGATFRPLTPEVTASTDAVWERLSEGDVLVSHELADELDLELGGDLVLETDATSLPVRIGAFAANGAPQLADILVPVDVASQLGVELPNTLVVAVGGGDPAQLGDALAEATGGEVEVRRELAPPVAEGAEGRAQLQQDSSGGQIEPFTYTSRTDGRITIHGDWIARNITRVQLPGMAATSCHRIMVPQLLAVVDELIQRDLYSHLDPSQFAGCFVARHIDWNPSRPLSMHAWGLAIDFNTRDNWLGAEPQMDPRVVEVFKRWGFDWGGDWSRPDGMHFELARLVEVP